MKESYWVKTARLAVGLTVAVAGVRMLAKAEVVHAQGKPNCDGLRVDGNRLVIDEAVNGECRRSVKEITYEQYMGIPCKKEEEALLNNPITEEDLKEMGYTDIQTFADDIKNGVPISCDGKPVEKVIEQVQTASAPMSLGFVEAVDEFFAEKTPVPKIVVNIPEIARQDAEAAANSEKGWQGAAEALPYVAIPATLFVVGTLALAIHNNSKNAQESKESEREFYKGIRRSREQNNSVPVKSPKLANEVEKESAQEDLEVDDASTVVRRRRRVSLDKVEKPEYWSKAGMDNVKRNIKLPSNQRVGITQAFRNGIYEKIEEETLKRNGLSKEELKRMVAEQNRRDGIMFNNLYGKKR